MKERVNDLMSQAGALFAQRAPLLSLWQETSMHFYPERADFTVRRSLGDDFAGHLMTGLPAMVRRDLANQIAAMLRPKGKQWFNLSVGDEDDEDADDTQTKAWLEDKAKVMRRAFYDTRSQFVRATKEGDHDFAAFGNAVLTVEANQALDGLLYRCWHLRDVVWSESIEGKVDKIFRRWLIPARGLARLFPKTVDERVTTMVQKEPEKKIDCMHICLPADEYDITDPAKKRDKKRFPFVSIYIDKDHDTILEEIQIKDHPYVIPRWQTVSGSQYAHSAATVIALPDARLLQQITLTLLEAGEKAVNPPLVATQEAVTSAVQIMAGGITWVDSAYDEKMGDALRVLDTGAKGGLAFGEQMADRYENLIKSAFYLDKITLPVMSGDMTATEVRRRTEDYIRSALPLFEPMEQEYNGAICEKSFNILFDHGAFGPRTEIPPALLGQEIRFKFESPLQEAAGRDVATAFQESAQLLGIAAQIDPDSVHEFDARSAFRDALVGISAPARWIVPDQQALQSRQVADQAKQLTTAASAVSGAAGVATQVGTAAQALQQAGLVPQAGQAAPIEPAPAL